MTLLAYDLPKSGQFETMPGWTDLYQLYAARLSRFVLSFIIAGLFWFSHRRRLPRQPRGSRNVVFLNLLFLLSIILLPVTNGLYGGHDLSSAVAVLYGLHLTAIATLNAAPRWLIRATGRHPDVIAAIFRPGLRARYRGRAIRPTVRSILLVPRFWRPVRATVFPHAANRIPIVPPAGEQTAAGPGLGGAKPCRPPPEAGFHRNGPHGARPRGIETSCREGVRSPRAGNGSRSGARGVRRQRYPAPEISGARGIRRQR
jgi:hypothetical protein